MALDTTWFTEIHAGSGSAFSLRVVAKLFDERSPFQHVEVYATEEFGNLMVIDGCVMLTQRDNFLYHEMLAHPALFSHPAPRRALIIGGGDCGTLREVLKHPAVEQVTQVDIDPTVTRAAERYFPELCESNHDPRARLEFADGVAWVKNAAPDSYDIILVDSTDPVGPAAGLFAPPFFQDCQRALAADGLLAQQSESPLFHLDSVLLPLRRNLRQSGFSAIQTLHFPQCVYPSGWWTVTLAGNAGTLAQLREPPAAFSARYYNAEIHRAALAAPEFMRQALAEAGLE